MASKSEAGNTRTARSVDLSWDNPDLDREQKPKRDWKKLFLVIGLGGLSWVATYVGMLELIEANMGDLPLIHKGIIGFSVAMLMVMVVWLLDQMFSESGWIAKGLYTAGYVFLTVISVGFGFGFYWKVLESRSEASRSAESAVGQVQNSLHAAMTRLEQLQGTLDSLTNISTQKAETERNVGTSCPNSKPGDGPRRKMRDDDASRFKFASDFVKGRVTAVKSDIAGLEGDLAKIVGDDKSTVDAKHGNRNEFMRNLGRKLDLTVTGFNAFRSDPQLKQIRIDLNERSDKVTFVDTKGGTYTCPDGQLTTALKGVVRAIDELPSLEKPKIAAVEGSEAVIEAFRRLTATFYGALSFKLPPSPEELRELQKKAVQSVEITSAQQAKINAMAEQAGLSKRDYVPLAIAIFVDLCLLLVSMRQGGTNRLQNLLPKMRAAERGPVIQILSRFNEIHRDQEIRQNFEVFRHVVFDFHGDYYAAVPLNAPYRPNPRNGQQRQGYGVSDAHELLQEAHLLANLFSSFEQEKIFTRVYSPLLSTKTVQKRLRRQGSKFANSESFRLYRFRDGAWSDIILGAVMGAARRVEAEQRRRRVEEDMFDGNSARKEPSLSVPTAAQATASAKDDAEVSAVAINGQRAYPFVVGRTPSDVNVGPSWMPPPGACHEPAQARPFSPAAHVMAQSLTMSRQPAPWPRTASAYPENAGPVTRPANNNTAPADRIGELSNSASQYAAEGPAGNVVMHPAAAWPVAQPVAQPVHQSTAQHPAASALAQPTYSSNTGSAAAAAATEGSLARDFDIPVPAPTVTVAAVRETVTYTLPVSEAAIPPSLLRAAAAKTVPTADVVEFSDLVAKSLPPPLPIHSIAGSEDHAETPANVPGSAEVIELPAAEADRAARAERTAWDAVHASGWQHEQAAVLDGAVQNDDDLRTMALRLRPQRRDA